MSPQITKEMALEIGSKLDAEIIPKSAHDLAKILYDGKVIAYFGIRRSSKKDKGHDHIPQDLHCTPHFCKKLADCTNTQEDWIDLMKKCGYI